MALKYMETKVKEEIPENESSEVEDEIKTQEEADESGEEGGSQVKNEWGAYGKFVPNFRDMDMPNPYACLYNQAIKNNIADKAFKLQCNQLDKLKEELKAFQKPTEDKKAKENRPRKKAVVARSSPYSIRERKKQPNYNENPYPTDTTVPLRRLSPRLMNKEVKFMNEDSLASEVNIGEIKKRCDGPLNMVDIVKEIENEENWEDHLKELGIYLAERKKSEKEVEVRGKSWTSSIDAYKTAKRHWEYPRKSDSLDGFKAKVSKLKMLCGSMEKVIRERITSIAVHPSKQCLIVAAGGTNGSLGIWVVNPGLSSDVGEGKRKSPGPASGVYMFEPHGAQINCASFCIFGGDRLITTSYDGTLRSLNLEKLVFDQLFASPQDLSNNWMQWHCQMSPNVILASQGTGNVYVLDDRSHNDHEAVLRCYERSCRTVSIHPLHPQYLATSSSCGYTSIWDLRKFKKTSKKTDNVSPYKGVVPNDSAICHLGGEKRSLSSSFFSPITGNGLLTTSSDDYIRIYDTSKLVDGVPNSSQYRVETGQKHNNRTGRWLTSFKAAWHPQRDDAFVVGSLAQPRQIEVFGRHGRLLTTIGKDGPLTLNTVCPVNVFHTYRMLLASGDTGGRVHLFL